MNTLRMTAWCVVLVVATCAYGQEGANGQEGDRDEGRPRENENGRRARLLAEFDDNGDGRLDDDEAALARAALRQARGDRPERARRGPREGDRPTRPSPEGRRGRGRGPQGEPGRAADRPAGPTAAMLLARYDSDGDRELNLTELRRLAATVRRLRATGDAPRERGLAGPGRAFQGRSFGPSGDRPGSGFGGQFGGPPGRTPGGFGGPDGPRRDPPRRIREGDDVDRPEDAPRDSDEGSRGDRPDRERDGDPE